MNAPLIAVSGSLAYDTVLHARGEFHSVMDPTKLDHLNLSFSLHGVQRSFGGTAGNIAYNLMLLGDAVSLHATLGEDGDDYLQRIVSWGVSTDHLTPVEGQPTSHAYILTDERHNQIAGFNPGAMKHGDLRFDPQASIGWAIVSPDSTAHMLQAARHWIDQGVPYAFDPGQGLSSFNADSALELAMGAAFTIVNAYEEGLLRALLGTAAFETFVEPRLVVTHGAKGVIAHVKGLSITLPPGHPSAVVDPTGCGDSFRAGLLHGLNAQWAWRDALALGATMGALKVAAQGAQGHAPTLADVRAAFERDFGVWPG